MIWQTMTNQEKQTEDKHRYKWTCISNKKKHHLTEIPPQKKTVALATLTSTKLAQQWSWHLGAIYPSWVSLQKMVRFFIHLPISNSTLGFLFHHRNPRCFFLFSRLVYNELSPTRPYLTAELMAPPGCQAVRCPLQLQSEVLILQPDGWQTM